MKTYKYFKGFKPLEVREDIHKAYNARNTPAHGGTIPQKDRNELRSVHVNLQDYARLSIQIFIQLLSFLPKNVLIDKLDNAFVDCKARNELKKLINRRDVRILSLNN